MLGSHTDRPTPVSVHVPSTFAVVPGRPLNAVELDRYNLIPRALAKRTRVYEIPALPGSYAGITLGRHVFLATDVADDGTSLLLAHELVHVRQWHEQGVIGFGRRYVGSFLRTIPTTRSWSASYQGIPAEQEARAEAERWRSFTKRTAATAHPVPGKITRTRPDA